MVIMMVHALAKSKKELDCWAIVMEHTGFATVAIPR
jgi:hypothetical protein